MTEAPESTERVSAASRLAAKRAAKAAAKAARRGTSAVPGSATHPWKRFGRWAEANRRVLGIVGASLFAVAAASVVARASLEARAHGAGAALALAVDASRARIVAPGETPPEDAVGESYPSRRGRAEAALARYRKLVSAHAGSGDAAAWGLLGEAGTLLELGKSDEARKTYARALERGRTDPFVEWRALEGLGFSFEAQGKRDEALRRFEELSTVQEGAYRVVGDYHRARILAAQDKREKAIGILDALFEAEKARPVTEAPRFVSVLEDARTLRAELATALGKPKLDIALPSAAPPGAPPAEPSSTRQIVEALRRQLADAKRNKRDAGGLTDAVLDALEAQGSKHVPAPAGGGETP